MGSGDKENSPGLLGLKIICRKNILEKIYAPLLRFKDPGQDESAIRELTRMVKDHSAEV